MLTITVKHTVSREILLWAAYRCVTGVHKKPTKKAVFAYLKTQIEMFGSDEESLCGPNWTTPYEWDLAWRAAKAFVDHIDTTKY